MVKSIVTEQPRWEGTSKDQQVQTVMAEGNLDEIIWHPVRSHLENLQ